MIRAELILSFFNYLILLNDRKKHDNKKVKKTLSIPSWLNAAAERENINFSRLLEEALRERLKLESR